MNNRLLNNSIVALSLLISTSALAYDAYHLRDDKWAVECKDGELASYSGDEKGLVDAGAALCKTHDGILGNLDNIVVKSLVATDGSTEKAVENEANVVVEGTENDKTNIPSKDEMKDILKNTESPQKAGAENTTRDK